jgi:hypothetical protein
MNWLTVLGTFVTGLLLTFAFAIGARLAPASSVLEITCAILTFTIMTLSIVAATLMGILVVDEWDAQGYQRRR